MIKHLVTYVVILVSFVLIDMVWLMGAARSTYVAEIGNLLRKQPNLVAAIAFYLLYAAGIWFFAVRPSSEGNTVLFAVMIGAALGLVAYGTYDLTNLSVMEGFGFKIAMIDLAWGTCVTAIAAGLGALTLRALG
jgi:uncharacterized membrane protein